MGHALNVGGKKLEGYLLHFSLGRGQHKNGSSHQFMVQIAVSREEFWQKMDMIRGRWNGAWCIGGDWNIIRFLSEKLGGSKITSDMRRFSDWINSHSLVDVQLSGASFTWSNNQSQPAMSRLDRFLASTDWLEGYPEVIQLALPKHAFDH